MEWLFVAAFLIGSSLFDVAPAIGLNEPLLIQRPGIYKTSHGHVEFSSDAPLENISAENDALRGVVDTATSEFAFSLSISRFMGFNGELQREHFNENYLESEQYPEASFTGRIIEDIPYSVPGTYAIRAKGYLTIHGVKRERIIPCKVVITPGGFKVTSAFSVLLGDHGIKIPRIVYEKISPEIRVTVIAELKPGN